MREVKSIQEKVILTVNLAGYDDAVSDIPVSNIMRGML